MKVLITGVGGFIGCHLAERMLLEGHDVFGIERNHQGDLTEDRLTWLQTSGEWQEGQLAIDRGDIQSTDLEFVFKKNLFDLVIHLAAATGIERSISFPEEYIDNNVAAFQQVLEQCRLNGVRFMYASSSSVYGNRADGPFLEQDRTDNPASLSAATKKFNEVAASAYSSMYGIETIGLRLFSVYGPWGRPDMAYHSFVDTILDDIAIQVSGSGDMVRDFTYIDDVVDAMMMLATGCVLQPGNASIYNIGSSRPVMLEDFISAIEQTIGKKAKKEYVGMQPGDVHKSFANTERLRLITGWTPKVQLQDGLAKFWEWYKLYYNVPECLGCDDPKCADCGTGEW